ncbi:MAG: hypothetical protein NTZ65_00950 [Candidatus Berkelbacteria bacterium]|nr:hypothetical protein [Candidatus Berkelbacteria bacterium]
MKNKTIAVFHMIVLLAAVLSPVWIDWQIIVVGYIIYILQIIIFKGCVLTFAQFGSENGRPHRRFTAYYIIKTFGIKSITEEQLGIKLDRYLAPAVPIVAIIIQTVFSYQPFVNIFK